MSRQSRLPRAIIGAALAVAAATSQASSDNYARAQEIVQGKCFICHGMEGESSSPVFPRLAGQHANYIERQLADYKSGRRASTTMQPMVDDLTTADFKALGAYFESRPTMMHKTEDTQLAQVGRFIYERGNPYAGIASCASCHGQTAHGTATLPRLAGQHAQYIEKQLRAFNSRERTNDNAIMHSIASKLTELELKAVAAFIAGLP